MDGQMFEEFLRLASELSQRTEMIDSGNALPDEFFAEHPPIKKIPPPIERPSLIGVDAASVSLHTALGEVAVVGGAIVDKEIHTHPDLGGHHSGPPYIGAPYSAGLTFVADKYVILGIPYREDPFLPEGAISSDLRMNLEVYLIKEVSVIYGEGLLMIDGPATYPFSITESSSRWAEEVGMLNRLRSEAILEAFKTGLTPICVVKRVWRSYHIPQASEAGLNDVVYLMRVAKNSLRDGVPVLV
ncbi:MAG: hypothetical protein J7L55_04225, partial [Desulfurococcales archaeon]|nr:hypothetical protein [Desulfurococcales archaeon]